MWHQLMGRWPKSSTTFVSVHCVVYTYGVPTFRCPTLKKYRLRQYSGLWHGDFNSTKENKQTFNFLFFFEHTIWFWVLFVGWLPEFILWHHTYAALLLLPKLVFHTAGTFLKHMVNFNCYFRDWGPYNLSNRFMHTLKPHFNK